MVVKVIKLLQYCSNLINLMKRGVITQRWSILVFNSNDIISKSLYEMDMAVPTLQASDVSDVQAEFVADPFIVTYQSRYFMFFEVLNKRTGRGEIAVAESTDGLKWTYQQIVLKEAFHLSYPQVFMVDDQIYMLPETLQNNRVLLYKATQFPLVWEVAGELFNGRFMDPSIIKHEDKWWIFTATEGKNLHLFYAEHLEGPWVEHACSPMITNNLNSSRPGGRVIASEGQIYRYSQDGYPYYGKSVKAFRVKKLSVKEYEEEEISIVLSGTDKDNDWRRDGMHHIDQLKLDNDGWLVAVDGHTSVKCNYFTWKLGQIKSKMFS